MIPIENLTGVTQYIFFTIKIDSNIVNITFEALGFQLHLMTWAVFQLPPPPCQATVCKEESASARQPTRPPVYIMLVLDLVFAHQNLGWSRMRDHSANPCPQDKSKFWERHIFLKKKD